LAIYFVALLDYNQECTFKRNFKKSKNMFQASLEADAGGKQGDKKTKKKN
jgi:hypothetical protein